MTVDLPIADPTSRTVDLDGPTHYLDYGGPTVAPLVVAVHGLGGGAWNWSGIAPLLTDHLRVLAIDLAGHGRTPRAGRTTSVPGNRRLLDRFLREVVTEPVVLMGNSMGGLITLLETAESPDMVRAAVLVDPALPRPWLSRIDPAVALSFAVAAVPGLAESVMNRRQRRQTPQRQMRETLALCSVDWHRIPQPVIDEGLRTATERPAPEFPPKDVLAAARSLVGILARPRVLRRRIARIQSTPVLLIHGVADRLVSVRLARAAASAYPSWTYEEMADVGHIPMMEKPRETADIVLRWLDSVAGVV
jgi:pimeloyl-ACP methyl ester carboxylesterase